MNCKTLLLFPLFFLGCFLPSRGQTFCPPNVDFEFGATTNWNFSTGIVTGTATTGPFYALTPTAVLGANFTLTSGAANDYYGGFPIVAPGGGSYSLKVGHAATGQLAERAVYYVEIPSGTTTYSLIYHYAAVLENPPTTHTAFQMPRLVVNAFDSATTTPIACISYTYVASSTLPGFIHSSTISLTGGGNDVYYKPWTTGNMKFNGENGHTVALQFTASDCTEGGHFGYGYIDMSCGLFAVSTITCGTSTATLSAPPGYSTYHWYDSATFATSYGTAATTTITVPAGATTYAVICTPYTGYGCPDTLYTRLVPTALVTAPSHDTAICAGTSVSLSSNATDISLPLTYSWAPSAGLSCTTCGTVTATPSVTTAYSVTTTDAGGCLHTDVINLTVYPNPVAITGAANVCVGSAATLGDATTGGRWASSSTAIATVGSISGIVGGVSSGSVPITYSFGSGLCSTTTTVNVNPLPALISGSSSVCAGLTTTLSDASTPGTWSSSATSTATVGSGTGIVGGIISGTSTITFTASTGCTRAVIMTVNPLPSSISGTASMCAGATTSLSDLGTGTWASGSLSVATVGTGAGVVSGVTPGTALITYILPTSCLTTVIATVNPSPTPISGSLSICAGASTPLSDATTGGTWTSSSSALATISGTGIVTGLVPGTSTITYTAPGGCQTSSVVTVNALPLSITGPSGLCAGTTATMSDPGIGSWSSSNLSVAIIDPATGIVTGVAASGGIDTIIYTLSTGCSAITTISIFPLPSVITGVDSVCVGSVTVLGDSTFSGAWTSSNTLTAPIDFGGNVTGSSAGTAIITYTSPSLCIVTTVVTVNPLPNPITGRNYVCSGSTTALSDVGVGTWTSSNTVVAPVGFSSGVLAGGAITSTSSVLITYTLPTGCSISTGETVYPPLPSIGGPLNICVGQSVFLTDGSAGGTWAASNTNASINPSLGILTGASPGTDVITYSVSYSGCSTSITVTVNSSPGIITGPTSICAGSTTALADAGGGTWTSGSPTIATAAVSTGTITGVAAGTSLITYSLGGTCVATTIVTVYPTPPLCTVSGGGAFCAGGPGVSVSCGPSTAGFSYQLYTGGVAIGTAFAGTGGTINFGLTTSPGVYTVVATSITTGCSRTMAGSATITVNALPSVYAVSGGGGYCSGGSGVHIILIGSDLGIHYQVYLGGSPVGSSMTGTGSSLDFGSFLPAGTYTIVATNTSTGCTSTMTGSATITISPLPTPFIVTGGGAFCSGGVGVHIFLSGSATGVSYQLYNGAAIAGPPVAGTGSSLDFGLHMAVGTYTITGTSASTLCSGSMTGSVVVTVNPTPTISGPTAVCAGASIIETAPGFTGGAWSSGSTSVATVGSLTGFVTGVLSGSSATITYTASTGCAATTVINVSSSPGPIIGSSTVCVGTSTIETDAITGGTWISGSTSIATVGSLTGAVTGAAIGSSIITYSLGTGCTVTKTMTATAAPAGISGASGLCVGTTTTLTDATSGGTWSSSNTAVATAAAGVVFGVSAGTSIITYTAGGCASTMIVNVNITPVAISGPVTVCVGLTITAVETITGGTWASSSTIATVNPASGVVSGVSPGTATIIYSLGAGCSVSEVITVTNAPALISGATGLCLGANEPLVETTTGGTWSCTPAGITTVTGTGSVTGAAIGTSTIVYNLGGCTASLIITVNPAPGLITGAASVCAGSSVIFSDPVSSGSWTSSNTAMATVSPAGNVWGVTGGTATISYSLGGSCIVTKNILVNPSSPVTGSTGICVGATTSLSDVATGGSWSSSTTTVATVNSIGIVGGVFSGTSTISYTTTVGCVSSTIINVNTAPSLITGIMGVCQAASTSLADGISGGSWSSSSAMATIDPVSGTVSGILPGTATITYSLGFGCVRTAVITVNPLPEAIAGSLNVCSGLSVMLSDSPTGGTWGSSATAVASVNATTGSVAGAMSGTTTITYTLPTGCSATKTVTVNPLPTPIVGTEIACTGSTSSLSGSIAGGSWTSGSTSIATADPALGIVTGAIPGTAIITYTLPTGCIATATVTINAAPGPILGMTSMCVGSATNLIEPTAGAWSSNNTVVAVVTGTGNVTGLSIGTSAISYSYSGCTTSVVVTVNSLPGAITGVANVCVGATTTLGDIPDDGTWSSASPSIASVDMAGGMVTGISPGTVLITYSVGVGCSVSAILTVNALPEPITGIPEVCFGSTTTLSDATSAGVWTSSNSAMAPVSPSGVVTGLAGGPATISYTNTSGCSATRLATVVAVPAIVGLTDICAYSTPVHVYDSLPGGTWTSTSATISSSGVVIAYAAGIASITYTIPLGCFTDTAFTVRPIPGPVTGINHFCIGLTSDLDDISASGAWSSSNTLIAPVDPAGVVTGVAAGTAVISYSLPTGCIQTDTITVYAHPSAVFGTANICVGATAVLGDAVTGGTWSSSSLSLATIGVSTGNLIGVSPGTATITYFLGLSCSATRIVTINALPAAYTVTGGGSYCAGDTGVHIGLSSSQTGVTYQLYRGTWLSGTAAGSGSARDFGLETVPGTYNAIATNTTTSCVNNMAGSGTITVTPVVVPSISIAALMGDTLCTGMPAIFAATTVNGGSSPAYQWLVNGSAAGTGTASLTYTPANGDIVNVRLTSDTTCAAPADTMSNSVTMTVDVPLTLIVNITALPGLAINAGDNVALTASLINGSPILSYQWYANNVAIPGATAATYDNNDFYVGDSLSCTVISYGTCNTTGSGYAIFTVPQPNNVGVTPLTLHSGLSVVPNPNRGEFVVKGSIGSISGKSDDEVSIEITDMLGQVIYKDKLIAIGGIVNGKISLLNIVSNGMYILTVRSGAESSVFHITIEQ